MPKVKEVTTLWPPLRGVAATGVSTQVELEDNIVSAYTVNGSTDRVGLTLQKKDGLEYNLFLVLPQNLVGKVVAIIGKNKMTLRELGELDV